MKKILTFLIVLMLSTMIFASFSFDLKPQSPLFTPYESDVFSPRNKISIVQQLQEKPAGFNIRFEDEECVGGEDPWYRTYDKKKQSTLLSFQTGMAFSLFRLNFDKIISLDFTAQAGFNALLCFNYGNDFIGFDGMYFVGGEAKIIESVLFKAGFRHFSGHTADEALNNLYKKNNPRYATLTPTEYVRDNVEIGVGYENKKFPYLSGKASIIIPLQNSFMEPFVHRPDNQKSNGANNAERNPVYYAVRGDYGSWYKALILQGEIKATYSPTSMLDCYLIVGGKLHQDGCTKHTLDPSDDDKKWESEIDLVLGAALKGDKLNVGMEVSYHNGRLPSLSYYWQRSQYISVGFRIY